MPLSANVLQQSLPPWLEGQFKAMGEQAEALRQAPYVPYPQNMQRYAALNPDILKSHELGRANLGEHMPYVNQAQEMFTQGAQGFPANVQAYMNPYTANVIKTMEERAGEAYKNQFLPQLENSFVGAGQHGSLKHQELAARGAKDMQQLLAQQTQDALMHGYDMSGKLFNADQARKIEAAQGIAPLGGLSQAGRLFDIGRLSDQGQYQQAHEQGRMNMQAQDFNEQRSYPWSQLGQQSAVMNAMPQPVSQTYAQQTPGQPQWNSTGNMLNAAGNMYGAYRAFGRKKGGAVKKTMNIPKLKGLSSIKVSPKKFAGLAAKKKSGMGAKSFMQSSFMRMPKVGAKSKVKMKGAL